MRSPGINGEGELSGQPANPGSPGKMAVKREYMCVSIVKMSQRWSFPWEFRKSSDRFKILSKSVPEHLE